MSTLLPNVKYLDWSKLKELSNDKINVTFKQILLGIGRKHCGKSRKCCLPAFSPFPQCFQKVSFSGSLEVGIVW